MKITYHKNGKIKTLVDEAPYHPGYEDAGFKPSPIKSRVNELADWIENGAPFGKYETAKQAVVMLRQQQAQIEALKKNLDVALMIVNSSVKELTGILATIKCIADDISGHKDYENTYSDGWIDACNTVYDEVFAMLRKEQDIKYDVTIKWDDKTTHHGDVSGDTPLHHTNPAELTDEEIECTRNQCGIELVDGTWRIDEQKFAKAILRKAQGK